MNMANTNNTQQTPPNAPDGIKKRDSLSTRLATTFDSPGAKSAQATGNLIGGATDTALGTVGAVQNKKARDEARDLAFQQRDMNLEQQERWQKLADRSFEQDEEQFELQKKIVSDRNRFDLFFREIAKSAEASSTIEQSAQRVGQKADMDDNFKQLTLSLMRGQ